VSEAEARELVVRSLGGAVAPDADLGRLGRRDELREALDIDSMDFLAFVTELSEATGLEIPESDYEQLETVDGCVGYLVRETASA
jgi:acyl carrier protein